MYSIYCNLLLCMMFLFRWLKSDKDLSKGIKLSEAGFQLIGLETTISGNEHHRSHSSSSHTDRIRWVTYLQVSSHNSDTTTTTTGSETSDATTTAGGVVDEIISFVKMIESPVPVRGKVIHQTNDATAAAAISSFVSMSSITIIVSTVTGKTFVWEIDSNTGRSLTSSSLINNENTCTTTTATDVNVIHAATENYVSHALSINTLSPMFSVMSSGVHTNSHTLVVSNMITHKNI